MVRCRRSSRPGGPVRSDAGEVANPTGGSRTLSCSFETTNRYQHRDERRSRWVRLVGDRLTGPAVTVRRRCCSYLTPRPSASTSHDTDVAVRCRVGLASRREAIPSDLGRIARMHRSLAPFAPGETAPLSPQSIPQPRGVATACFRSPASCIDRLGFSGLFRLRCPRVGSHRVRRLDA